MKDNIPTPEEREEINPDEKHPYMRLGFWIETQFWHRNRGIPHSQKSKDYLDNWLKKWINAEKSLSEITQIKPK